MELLIVLGIISLGVLGHNYAEPIILGVTKGYGSIIVKTSRGRSLQSELRGFFGQFGGSILLPQYKFFTPLCHEVKALQVRQGLASSTLLKNIRPWLTNDVHFEEKLQSLLKNSLVQFIFLSLFTWVFYLNARFSLEITSNWRVFTFLQVAGLVSFLYFYKLKKEKTFKGLEELTQRVFLFKTLKGVGLPMGEVLARTKADQSLVLEDSKVETQAETLLKLCQKWTSEGHEIEDELSEILEELDFLREEKRRRFELNLAALRFIHLIIFYLFGYFLVILDLIRQLALSY